MFVLIIVFILIAAPILYSVVIYNSLIQLKNNVSKNWSNIDVLLKQRYSEVPKLIDACKGYMKYESETLEKIVETRSAALKAIESKDLTALSQTEVLLKGQLGRLFALAENYPDLKTNQLFLTLQTRISSLESEISDRRELYNDSVNRNNIRIEIFPDIIIARLFHFGSFSLLQFDRSEIKDVDVASQFKNTE